MFHNSSRAIVIHSPLLDEGNLLKKMKLICASGLLKRYRTKKQVVEQATGFISNYVNK